MVEFFDNYFNIKKIVESKREYKRQMARVAVLPEDYQYVFKKIQTHMWQFAAGSGYDLIELFEDGAASGYWKSPVRMSQPS
jgi:DNA-binding ferritin-like protein (Dps family)